MCCPLLGMLQHGEPEARMSFPSVQPGALQMLTQAVHPAGAPYGAVPEAGVVRVVGPQGSDSILADRTANWGIGRQAGLRIRVKDRRGQSSGLTPGQSCTDGARLPLVGSGAQL